MHATLDMKGGISVSANLREAFKTLPLLQKRHAKATVLIDTATMLVPDEEFDTDEASAIFDHAFSGYEQDAKLYCEMPRLHTVALFAVNKDIQTVLNDHFDQVEYMPVCLPVWQQFSQREDGPRQRLYCYFHDDKLDIFAFSKHRFKFCNTFSATHSHDALYYLLSAFTQLGLKAERDEVILSGVTPHQKWIIDHLSKYVDRSSIFKTLNQTLPDTFPLDLHLLSDELS